MDQFKNWLTSRTVWVAAIGTMLQVLHIFNVKTPLDTVDQGQLADHMVNAVSAVLFLAAIFFRATATKKLSA